MNLRSGASSTTTGRDAARGTVLGPLVMGAFATALISYGLSLPGALYGIVQYDDGVYFGAAIRLVAGQIPYRDFTLVQPPGIAVLFAPLALIARAIGTQDGMAAARIITAVVAGLNAYLAGRLLRSRGVFVATTASLIVALFPAAVFADRTLLLEPYVVLFCLLGARCCFDGGTIAGPRSLLAGGALFGLATATKTWAIVIVGALLLTMLSERARAVGLRDLTRMLIGFCIGVGAICLPFFAAAPSAFLREVIGAQLGRQAGTISPDWLRLADIFGLRGSGTTATKPLALVIAAVITALVVIFGVVPMLRGKASAVERFVLFSTAGAIVALLIPQEFSDHYAYFAAPFLACAIACSLGRALQLVAPHVARLLRSRRVVLPSAALAVLALLAGISWLVGGEVRYANGLLEYVGNPTIAIDLAVPKGSCAISDAAILLVEANRLTSNVKGCPELLDATGLWLADAPNELPFSCAPVPEQLVETWQSYFSKADFFVESGSADLRVPWTVGLRTWFLAHYRQIPDPGAEVFVRDGTSYETAAIDPANWTAKRLAAAGWRRPTRHAPPSPTKPPACLPGRT